MPQTVLCVDDDRNLCQILAKALAGEGYCVRTAHDGDEAVASVQAVPPDLLLLDLLLPRRDGFGVLSAIRALPGAVREVPAIVLSGCTGTPDYLERAKALRASAFLTKPVPLDLLLEKVRVELLGSARAREAEPRETAAPPLSGSLADLPFPALLHQLHGLRASGALLLASGKKRKGLQLSDGRPVAVRSNLVSECLGNLLVRMERIEEAALRESLARMQRGEGLQGQILVAMHLLSEDELAAALRLQAEEKLLEVFEWSDGTFEFKRNGRLKGASTLSLERSPADVIVEGVRTRFPIARIDEFLRANADARLGGGEIPFYQFQDVDLGNSTGAWLAGHGGSSSVADLLRADERTRRLAYGMLAAQIIELRRERAGAADVADAQADAVTAARARLAAAGHAAATGTTAAPRAAAERAYDGIRSELAAMAERLRGRSYFEVLGVSEDADDEQVRAAYVDLAKRTHPDRFSGATQAVKRLAEEVFGLVSQAYESLSTEGARQDYRMERVRGARLEEELDEARRAVAAEREFNKGEAALRERSYDRAFEAFRKAVELFPAEGEYLAHLAWTRFLSAPGSTAARDEAVRGLRRAAKLAPDSEKPYLLLGQLYKAIGQAESAERMFMRAVQQKSDCVEALRELRLINMRREKQRGLVRKLLRR